MSERFVRLCLEAAVRAFVLAALFSAATASQAQESVLPPQPAPPPMKYVPESERAQLDSARDAKQRVRTSLALMEERLTRAEQLTGAGRFDPAAAELGIYEALAEDMLKHLASVGRSADGVRVDGSTRDLYKRIELTLNKHTARIEAMRRVTPQESQGNVRATFFRAREMRTEALNSFFGNTVLREPAGRTQNSAPERPSAKRDSTRPPPED